MLGAAVAVAAHGRTWSTHAGQSGWSARTFALIVIAGVALVALLLALTVWRHRSQADLSGQSGQPPSEPVILTALALIAVALLYQHFTPPPCYPNWTAATSKASPSAAAPRRRSRRNHGPAAQGKLIAG